MKTMSKGSMRIFSAIVLLSLVTGSVWSRGQRQDQGSPQSAAASVITDLAGRSVSLASPLRRAVALAGPSYEKVFMLGQASRLAGAHFYMTGRPWVQATNPAIASVQAIRNPAEPNVEELLNLGTDCVFFWDYAGPLASLENAGIPVVVVQNSSGNPRTQDEFIAYQKREIQVFADALGDGAKARAGDWFSYFDEKIAYVRARTAAIPRVERKTAIYAYGEEGLGLFSQYSYVSFWLELAGGRNIADETGREMDTEVTMEEIISWDPDVIFMGRMESA
ncbi:MAG: ABC transporter substrate-binding protein, partial [Treponema sp.]|nr:ABC transporter substrate-binding protein [Treponema sp.]